MKTAPTDFGFTQRQKTRRKRSSARDYEDARFPPRGGTVSMIQRGEERQESPAPPTHTHTHTHNPGVI